MKVSPWKGGWLVLQIRALSGTEIHLLDLKQMSVNSSLKEKKKSRTPASPKHPKHLRPCRYRTSWVHERQQGKCAQNSRVTLRTPHVFNWHNSSDAAHNFCFSKPWLTETGHFKQGGAVKWVLLFGTGILSRHFSFLQHDKEILSQGGICLKMGSKV